MLNKSYLRTAQLFHEYDIGSMITTDERDRGLFTFEILKKVGERLETAVQETNADICHMVDMTPQSVARE